MARPSLIGITGRSWPGASGTIRRVRGRLELPPQAQLCEACGNYFLAPTPKHGCYRCTVTEAKEGDAVRAKQEDRLARRRENDARARAHNPCLVTT